MLRCYYAVIFWGQPSVKLAWWLGPPSCKKPFLLFDKLQKTKEDQSEAFLRKLDHFGCLLEIQLTKTFSLKNVLGWLRNYLHNKDLKAPCDRYACHASSLRYPPGSSTYIFIIGSYNCVPKRHRSRHENSRSSNFLSVYIGFMKVLVISLQNWIWEWPVNEEYRPFFGSILNFFAFFYQVLRLPQSHVVCNHFFCIFEGS